MDRQLEILINQLDELNSKIENIKSFLISVQQPIKSEVVNFNLKNPEIVNTIRQIENKINFSDIINLLNLVNENIKNIKITETKIDFSKIETYLKNIESEINKINNNKDLKNYFKELQDKLEELIKEKQPQRIYTGGYSSVGIKNSSDTRINPATEETLQNINNKLNQTNEELGLIKVYTGDIQNKVQELFILDKYALSDVDDSSSVKYYGYVGLGGIWYILEEDTVNKTYRYANGDYGYEENWTNRSSLTYDYFYNVFF